MTNNTTNEGIQLPCDILATIASFLDYKDLVSFRLLCRDSQFVIPFEVILQPAYNRLYVLDNTLPPLLPKENALSAFQEALKKIQKQQQSEIAYLTLHNLDYVTMSNFKDIELQYSTETPLQTLERIDKTLNHINFLIIRHIIFISHLSPELNLNNAHITRFSRSSYIPFYSEGFEHFWQNLTSLNCNNNRIRELSVQDLPSLEQLTCQNNGMVTLKLQRLPSLIDLNCSRNLLTNLNISEHTKLKNLNCRFNQITKLDLRREGTLTRLSFDGNPLKGLILNAIKNEKHKQQRVLFLHKCLSVSLSFEEQQTILNLLDDDFNRNLLLPCLVTDSNGIQWRRGKNTFDELERHSLFHKLSKTESSEDRQIIISRLGNYYTYENCLKYCPTYAATLFDLDFLDSLLLPQEVFFLTSFENSSNLIENAHPKRKRDQEIDTEELSEEPENEPDLKKRKKK